MHRRHFVTTAATASALAASGTLSVSAGRFTGKIKKAIKFHMIGGDDATLSVEDKFRLLQDLGFDGVEVRTEMKNDAEQKLTQYEKARERTGLPIEAEAPDHWLWLGHRVITADGATVISSPPEVTVSVDQTQDRRCPLSLLLLDIGACRATSAGGLAFLGETLQQAPVQSSKAA